MSRSHAEAILRAAIAAAAPGPLVQRALEGAIELDDDAPVHVLAIGKAAPAMVEPALERYGSRVVRHLVIAPAGTRSSRPITRGGHPLPDGGSTAAGREALELVAAAGPDDHVLVLLSGGASASAAVPLGDVTVEEYADCMSRLMRAGADIGELNTVRRHLDALKGGRLAVAAPGRVLGLVLSDVVGDPLDIIASGPLTPDPSRAADALDVLRRHDVLQGCARSIIRLLARTAETGDLESPGPEHAAFAKVRVRVIGGNDVAINGAAEAAEQLGYRVRRATEPVTGRAHLAGERLAAEAVRILREEALPTCVLAGGETTVLVGGRGRGGRNQELVLAACIALGATRGITVGSLGTDGVDGPTDAAGAVADAATLERAADLGVDPRRALDDNDSHSFFSRVGGLIVTGPTGTNVNDVQVALVART